MSEQSRTPFCAALIAGGKSTRMGRDKRLIEFFGRPLWRHQLVILESLQPAELVISGEADGPWKNSSHRIIPDDGTNAGPLAGIATVLEKVRSPLTLMLAVDMPYMTASFLQSLLDESMPTCGVVPTHAGMFEPLAAIYSQDCVAIAANRLRHREFSLQHFVQDCVDAGLLRPLEIASQDSTLFRNWNTPDDLK